MALLRLLAELSACAPAAKLRFLSRLFEPAGPGPEQALVAEQFRAAYNFALTTDSEFSPMSMVIGEI